MRATTPQATRKATTMLPDWTPKPPRAVAEADARVRALEAEVADARREARAAQARLNNTPPADHVGGEARGPAQADADTAMRKLNESLAELKRAERELARVFADAAPAWAPEI